MLHFIQDKILLAVHPWCTLNIAKKKDLKFWCLVKWGGVYLCKWQQMPNEVLQIEQDHESHYNWYQPFPVPRVTTDNYRDQPEYIIWLPPTLSRVLTALWENRIYSRWNICYIWRDWLTTYFTKICKRKLLNEDGTDATLFDQSEETQKAIAILFWRKDE